MPKPEYSQRIPLPSSCPRADNSLPMAKRVPIRFVLKPGRGFNLDCINLTPDKRCAPTANSAPDLMPLLCPVAADLFVSGQQEGVQSAERAYQTRAGVLVVDFENEEIISAPSWKEGTAPKHVPTLQLWMFQTLLDAQGRMVERSVLMKPPDRNPINKNDVDVQILRLRDILGEKGREDGMVQTLRGRGFRIPIPSPDLSPNLPESSQPSGHDGQIVPPTTGPIQPDLNSEDTLPEPSQLSEIEGPEVTIETGAGIVQIDTESFEVLYSSGWTEKPEEPVVLRYAEGSVFMELVKNQGSVRSRDQLIAAYDPGGVGCTGKRTVDVSVRRIREKLGFTSIKVGKSFIETLRGQGYRIPRKRDSR